MNLLRIIEKIISIIKNDNNYRIKTKLTKRQLIEILRVRAIQIFRGFIKRLRFKKINGIAFIGKYVRLEHGYNISSGKGLIIEDFVHINAFSEQGVILGNNVTIGKYTSVVCSGIIANLGVGIEIGDNSAIGAQSFLGGQGGIEIGGDVIMGPGVRIFSENHNYDNDRVLIRKQGENRNKVLIGNNCWIGAGVTILCGVEIGNGCVIAAGSVVTKSIPENSVVAGVPAKVVRPRVG
jgi:acetyltransferase-like isoleucine patch superfamily enzyme